MKQNAIVEDDRLLSGLYLQLMTVNILIGLVQPFNQFVDSMLTGRGLGLEALKAYALFLPVGSLILALSSFFALGTQITCSHMLGSGRFSETKKLVQTALLSGSVFSVLFAVVLFGFSSQIAVLLGANPGISGQIQETASYLRGYALGIPAIFLVSIMISLLQLEGKKKFVVLLSLCIFVINATGDLANIFVFKKGLFGMAAATAAANITVFLLLLIYFLAASRMFHFSLAGFQKGDLLSIFRNGLPSLSYFGSLVIRTVFFNMLILTTLDGTVLAVMLVVNSFMTVIDAAIGGTGDATLLLGAVLYGQKDIRGQRRLLKTALIAGGLLLFVLNILSVIFAVPIAGLFSNDSNPEFIAAAARAIRLTSMCFVVDVLACVLKKYIQSVGRAKYTSVTNVLCNVVYVCIAAWILVRLAGSDGLFLSFTVCYGLILITHIVYAYRISQSSGRSGFDRLLFLPTHYEVSDANQWVYSIRDINGCVKASQRLASLCREHGADKREAYLLALFVEEMTTNVIAHGFQAGGNSVIVVKALFLEDRIVLNILDDCPFFDPTYYYDKIRGDEDAFSGIGIRLVVGLAKDIVYTNSFSLNNVIIEI